MTDEAPVKEEGHSSSPNDIHDDEAMLARVRDSSNRLDYKTAIELCTQVSQNLDTYLITRVHIQFTHLALSFDSSQRTCSRLMRRSSRLAVSISQKHRQ